MGDNLKLIIGWDNGRVRPKVSSESMKILTHDAAITWLGHDGLKHMISIFFA